jgi:hypothetical protein
MDRFSNLKKTHQVKMAKQQRISRVEIFGDKDPPADMMEDLR